MKTELWTPALVYSRGGELIVETLPESYETELKAMLAALAALKLGDGAIGASIVREVMQ